MEGEEAMTIEPVVPLTTAVLNAALAEVMKLKAENETLRLGWDERAAKLQEEIDLLRARLAPYKDDTIRHCVWEPRPHADGPGPAWCRTHGYDCPQLRPMPRGQSELR